MTVRGQACLCYQKRTGKLFARTGLCVLFERRRKMTYSKDQIQQMITELTPKAISCLRDMLYDPGTPEAVRAQLIGMVLDRTLGKAEVPIKVTSVRDNIENSRAKLSAMLMEIRGKMALPTEAETENTYVLSESGGTLMEEIIGEEVGEELEL